MTVKELIAKLNEMPMDAEVYAEGEPADKVIYEPYPFNEGGLVRIFKEMTENEAITTIMNAILNGY